MKKNNTIAQLLNSSLDNYLSTSKKNLLIGEDINDPYGGAFKVTKNLSTKYKSQVFQMPISEQAFSGAAIGLTLKGYNVVVEIMFCDFMTLLTDNLINLASKYSKLANNSMTGKMLIRTAAGGHRGYGPIHSQNLEQLFFGWPNIEVHALNRFVDPGILIKDIFNSKNKINILIESKIDYPQKLFQSEELADNEFELLKLDNHFNGSFLKNIKSNKIDILFFSYGSVIKEVIEAANKLLIEEELFSGIVVPNRIFPHNLFYKKIIEKYKPNKIVVVDDGYDQNGWGAGILSFLSNLKIEFNLEEIIIIGSKFDLIPANFQKEKTHFPTSSSIFNKIKSQE